MPGNDVCADVEYIFLSFSFSPFYSPFSFLLDMPDSMVSMAMGLLLTLTPSSKLNKVSHLFCLSSKKQLRF